MKLKVKVNKSKRKKEKTKKKEKKTRHSSILFLCIWVWRIPCQDGTVHTVHTAGEVCTSGHGNFSTTLSIAMGLWQLKFKHCYLVYNPRSPTLAFHHDVFSHPRGHMVAWRRLLKISKPLGPQSRRVHIVLYYPVITSRERKSKGLLESQVREPVSVVMLWRRKTAWRVVVQSGASGDDWTTHVRICRNAKKAVQPFESIRQPGGKGVLPSTVVVQPDPGRLNWVCERKSGSSGFLVLFILNRQGASWWCGSRSHLQAPEEVCGVIWGRGAKTKKEGVKVHLPFPPIKSRPLIT